MGRLNAAQRALLERMEKRHGIPPAPSPDAGSEPERDIRDGTMRRPLSARQREVVQAAADGLTNHATADRLGISLESVKTHWILARGRLDARSRAHAVAVAWRNGLID